MFLKKGRLDINATFDTKLIKYQQVNVVLENQRKVEYMQRKHIYILVSKMHMTNIAGCWSNV